LIIKDRFLNGNLKYDCINPLGKSIERYLFIGQPLVEEGFISKKKYMKKLALLSDKYKDKLDYLLHPRESTDKLESLNLSVFMDSQGAEHFCSEKKYMGYLSVFSTVNLNLCFVNNYYLAGYFGFKNINYKLSKLAVPGIKVVSSLNQL